MRRVTPNQHRLEYGEVLSWSPPVGAVKFLVWTQPRITSFDDLGVGATEIAYGGPPPAWTEAGGYDITADEKITPEKGTPLPGAEATVAGVTVSWPALMALSQGLMTRVLQIIAYDGDGKAIQLDHYSVPAPSSTDASVIAAQERKHFADTFGRPRGSRLHRRPHEDRRHFARRSRVRKPRRHRPQNRRGSRPDRVVRGRRRREHPAATRILVTPARRAG